MKDDLKYGRCVDDSCLLCGRHPSWGGHYFNGEVNEAGNYEVDEQGEMWLVIEHLDNCYVWLCPNCRRHELGRWTVVAGEMPE